jgi:hypothetical protein
VAPRQSEGSCWVDEGPSRPTISTEGQNLGPLLPTYSTSGHGEDSDTLALAQCSHAGEVTLIMGAELSSRGLFGPVMRTRRSGSSVHRIQLSTNWRSVRSGPARGRIGRRAREHDDVGRPWLDPIGAPPLRAIDRYVRRRAAQGVRGIGSSETPTTPTFGRHGERPARISGGGVRGVVRRVGPPARTPVASVPFHRWTQLDTHGSPKPGQAPGGESWAAMAQFVGSWSWTPPGGRRMLGRWHLAGS